MPACSSGASSSSGAASRGSRSSHCAAQTGRARAARSCSTGAALARDGNHCASVPARGTDRGTAAIVIVAAHGGSKQSKNQN